MIFWSKIWGRGLYDEHKTKTVFFQNQNFGIHPNDELDDVAVDFIFEEFLEPEEMTDDDSGFRPRIENCVYTSKIHSNYTY